MCCESIASTSCSAPSSVRKLSAQVYAVLCPQALKGGYVEPGPGGDPIRNPSVLPTGKNIHALDPQSIPTQAALKSARVVVERYRQSFRVW